MMDVKPKKDTDADAFRFWTGASRISLVLFSLINMVIVPSYKLSYSLAPHMLPLSKVGLFLPMVYGILRWLTIYRIREDRLSFLKACFAYEILCSLWIFSLAVPDSLFTAAPVNLPGFLLHVGWPAMFLYNLVSIGRSTNPRAEVRYLVYAVIFIVSWAVIYNYAYNYGYILSLQKMAEGR